jgi:GTPase
VNCGPSRRLLSRGVAFKGSSADSGSEADAGPTRSAKVALIGRPNVGKSTILNAALEQPLAIVSPTPQTTRDALLGVVHHGRAEIALLDTPGLHRPRTELGRMMNRTAREAAREADIVVFVTDVPEEKPQDRPAKPKAKAAPPAPAPRSRGPQADRAAADRAAGARGKPPLSPSALGRLRQAAAAAEKPLTPHAGDLALLADVGADLPTILVVNKIDRMKDKGRLLPLLEALAKVRPFVAVVPISARRSDGVLRVLDEVAKLCPEGPWRYAEDELTDRPVRFFAGEYVREQILRATADEVPHSAAVTIDEFVEPSGPGAVRIGASIHVERPGQKRIMIGSGGEMLKRIGTKARLRIEELTGRKVHLALWVRVTPGWRESTEQLEELGYGRGGGDKGRNEDDARADLALGDPFEDDASADDAELGPDGEREDEQ